jgi:uncharacterized protein (TIGR03086 family)
MGSGGWQYRPMTDDLMGLFATAAAEAEQVIAAIRPEQLDNATPCTDWNVRALLNHMVGGNLAFLSMVTGGPRPDRSATYIGDDPAADFRASVDALRAEFGADGFAARPVTTPLGDGVGAVLVNMRTTEFLLHGWDLAVATGQPRDFDPDVVRAVSATLQTQPIPRGPGSIFHEANAAPDGASAVDAVAAFTGREVPAV